MKLIIASDHGGFILKEQLKKYLANRHELIDLGTDSEQSVDYPSFGQEAAKKVVTGVAQRAIILCGTGIGISIAANKVKGARAALCRNVYDAQMSRKHNNANILALGGRTTTEDIAKMIVDTWLETEFEGGRHQRRIDQLEN